MLWLPVWGLEKRWDIPAQSVGQGKKTGEFPLPQPFNLLFYSGPQWIEWCPPTPGRAIYFPESTNSNVRLTHKINCNTDPPLQFFKTSGQPAPPENKITGNKPITWHSKLPEESEKCAELAHPCTYSINIWETTMCEAKQGPERQEWICLGQDP